MKKITVKFEYYFHDDVEDKQCFLSAVEMAEQDDIDDDNLEIEYNAQLPK